jgi:CheY-like chemotaxis protein
MKIKSDLRQISLLIVEDGEDIINIMDRTFKMLVKEIDLAKDGKEGLERYNNKMPDVILTDLRMPNLNGIDFIKQIRQTNKDIPIIMITAYEYDLSEEDKLFITDIFPKPINFMKLVQRLDECVQNIK